MEIDLTKVEDQFCPNCKAKKEKYIGEIMGSKAVFFRPICACSTPFEIYKGKTQNQTWEEINTPFWRLMGAKPKPRDIKLEKYLKSKNMTYGDWRRAREYNRAHYPSAVGHFQEHIKKYGTKNEPDPQVNKDR